MRKITSANFHNEKALRDYCSAFTTLSMISGRWKLPLLFALQKQNKTYSEFKIILPDISDRILFKQLNELISDGLIQKKISKKTSMYSLTDKGKKLEPVLRALKDYE